MVSSNTQVRCDNVYAKFWPHCANVAADIKTQIKQHFSNILQSNPDERQFPVLGWLEFGLLLL